MIVEFFDGEKENESPLNRMTDFFTPAASSPVVMSNLGDCSSEQPHESSGGKSGTRNVTPRCPDTRASDSAAR